MSELSDTVTLLLVTEYDFTNVEAANLVEESQRKNPDFWNDSANEEDLAEFLANGDDDE